MVKHEKTSREIIPLPFGAYAGLQMDPDEASVLLGLAILLVHRLRVGRHRFLGRQAADLSFSGSYK